MFLNSLPVSEVWNEMLYMKITDVFRFKCALDWNFLYELLTSVFRPEF